VKVFRTNTLGKDLITEVYKEGDFFGYLPLLRDEKYTGSATALEDSEIYMLPKDDFFTLMFKHKEVSRKFIEILSDNLHNNETQLLKLAYDSVRKRVATALVKLYDTYTNEPGKELSMNIAREDLANIVGTATETVIRTLGDFKDDKYISILGSNITILDYDKLANMKN
jgi:CRP-like cAMP-binding protein